MKKPKTAPIKTAAAGFANAAKVRLPAQLEAYLDGLDASIDGRGYDASHQKAADFVIEAVRRLTIHRDALTQIAEKPGLDMAAMRDLAKAALR